MDAHSEETRYLLQRIRLGDAEALCDLFARHRPRLRAMVRVRLDARLQGRIDPSDVLQEAYLDAAARLDAYLASAHLPPFLWLRLIVGERLLKLHRYHLGTQRRDAGREVSLSQQPAASSAALAAHLADDQTSPSQAALKAERAGRLQQALDALHPDDREILALRQPPRPPRCSASRRRPRPNATSVR
jgi:RNA polymerase sigma-70 factor (ECF subfamily)